MAALLVVAAHLGHREFATGFVDRQILGDVAVPFFFVLSGFVIRYVTLAREHTLREFSIDRAARIYSVVLPAMVLTVGLALVCSRLAPAYYSQHFAAVSDHPAERILLNLAFLSQTWGHNTVPFIDSPFWSLSYECLYYAGYGLFFYLRGWRRVAGLLIWAAIAGPQVLFLLPIWGLGCVVYDTYHALRRRQLASMMQTLAFPCLVLCLFGLAFEPVRRIPALLKSWCALPNPLHLLGFEPMRATMLALGTGCVAAVLLLLLLGLADAIPLRARSIGLQRFRRVADGTFAIYLMHYPLMVFATVLGLLRPHRVFLDLAIVASICVLLIAAAGPIEALKQCLKIWFSAAVSRVVPLPGAAPEPVALATRPAPMQEEGGGRAPAMG